MSKEINLIGQRHERLLCVEYLGLRKRADGHNDKIWRCVCDCGNEKIVTTDLFKRLKSCGCYKKEYLHNKLYKGRNRDLASVLSRVIERCYDSNSKAYHNYGARGIDVCNEWLNDDGASNFQDWAYSSGYQKGLTIDRIDNNKGYSPSNCRWVDMKVQSNNKRNNIYVEIDGITKTLMQWCEQYNVPYSRVRVRYQNMGWNIKDALFTPPYRKRG